MDADILCAARAQVKLSDIPAAIEDIGAELRRLEAELASRDDNMRFAIEHDDTPRRWIRSIMCGCKKDLVSGEFTPCGPHKEMRDELEGME